MSRAAPEVRLGSVSLIPLRGSENEMRRSVAAFAADPLSVSGFQSLRAEGWGLAGSTFHLSHLSTSDCPPPVPSLCPPTNPDRLFWLA